MESLLVWFRWKNIFRYGMFFLVACLLIAVFFEIKFGPNLSCSFADGPFDGSAMNQTVEAPANTNWKLQNNFTLFVYPPQSSQSAPIIELKDQKNESLWAKQIIGHGRTEILDISITNYKPPRIWWGSIEGHAIWKDGKERLSIFISRTGQYGGYCLSW